MAQLGMNPDPKSQEQRGAAGGNRLSPAPPLCPWLEQGRMGRRLRWGTAQTEAVPALIWQKRAQR